MPPAFNLSQDQTLQFNPEAIANRDCASPAFYGRARYSLKVIAKVNKNLARPGVSLVKLSVTPTRLRAFVRPVSLASPSAHTYRLFNLLKNTSPKGDRYTPREGLVAGIGFEPMTFGL